MAKKAWLILGDFNSVLATEDSIGGNPVAWADQVVDFANCIDECGMIQLSYQGERYTWNDKSSMTEYSPR